ncbi:hypothetical protein [Anaerobacillus arseniciselenatis]|uniref:hypothetical protein n=1 Tax=Anaerobacillus arseniciselenatis TaxID=85682 RepID=UPI00111436F6|nr:hypothetical protein [Anaerobacillus arseniciselenatis]
MISQNKNIVEIKDFHVKSDSTELETSARGTVFLSGEKGEVPELAQIVVFVEVDPDDWGGVVIHLSDQWNITSITSSFPNDNNNSPSVWTTADTPDHGWNKFIEIGRDRTRYSPTGGGKGTVIIELEINKDTLSTSDVLRMGVAVGSKEKDGVRIANPDSKDIGIPISIP